MRSPLESIAAGPHMIRQLTFNDMIQDLWTLKKEHNKDTARFALLKAIEDGQNYGDSIEPEEVIRIAWVQTHSTATGEEL